MNKIKLGFLLTISAISVVPSNSSAMASKIIGNALFGTALAGSAISFRSWLPVTRQVIAQKGFQSAIRSTHIPRLAVDALSMAACGYGLYQTNKELFKHHSESK